MNIRRYIPPGLRLYYQLGKRYVQDRRQGLTGSFARLSGADDEIFSEQMFLEQLVRASAFAANKVYNLQKAARSIEAYAIGPGEVFSFWRAVGPPTRRKGFREGRNIVNGVLTKGYGGGLCQLSGIIYHLALMAGMEILERHHHSVDIYQEEERFCPLGSDATVVFGYKDLRFSNPHPYPLRLQFGVDGEKVRAAIWATRAMAPRPLRFSREDFSGGRQVQTEIREDGQWKKLASSFYRLP